MVALFLFQSIAPNLRLDVDGKKPRPLVRRVFSAIKES
jgi:hypothetical protein